MRAARLPAQVNAQRRPKVGPNIDLPPIGALTPGASIADAELAAASYAIDVAHRFPGVPERHIAQAAFRSLTTTRQRYADPESDRALERLCPLHHPSHGRGPTLTGDGLGLPSLARQYARGLSAASPANIDSVEDDAPF